MILEVVLRSSDLAEAMEVGHMTSRRPFAAVGSIIRLSDDLNFRAKKCHGMTRIPRHEFYSIKTIMPRGLGMIVFTL